MTALEWKNDYKTGFSSIDHEHEQLILAINGMFAPANKARQIDTLGDIHALVEAHFALEEKIMRDSRYADYVVHKQDHDRLLEDIRDIMDDVESDRQTDIGAELQERMSSWFGNHFATLDRDLHTKLGH